MYFKFQGCYDTVKDVMVSNFNIVVGVAVGVLALQILGIIFAFCLCKAIGNDRDYHYKYWPRASGSERGSKNEPKSKEKQEKNKKKEKKNKDSENDQNFAEEEETRLVV